MGRFQHRADGHDLAQINTRGRRPQRHAQGEIAAEREAGLKPTDGTDHLGDAVRMKQLRIQVVAGPVVAHVQTEHIIAPVPQVAGRSDQIQGVGAALPAVDQHGQTARRLLVRPAAWRKVAMQPYAVATVEQHVAGGLE